MPKPIRQDWDARKEIERSFGRLVDTHHPGLPPEYKESYLEGSDLYVDSGSGERKIKGYRTDKAVLDKKGRSVLAHMGNKLRRRILGKGDDDD